MYNILSFNKLGIKFMTYQEIKAQLKDMDNQELSQLSFYIYAILRDEDMVNHHEELEAGKYCIENAHDELDIFLAA